MNLITDFFRKPLGAGLVAFILGLIIGLPVLGWRLMPVQWTDAAFKDLREADRQEYVLMVAETFALDQDADQAVKRLATLCGIGATDLCPQAAQAVSETVAASANNPAALPRLAALQALVSAVGVSEPETPQPTLLQTLQLPLAVCGLVVLVGLAVGGFFYWRTMSGGSGAGAAKPRPAFTPARPSVEMMGGEGAPIPASSPTGAAPIAQFMTTYVLGDDTYDDSFPIDGPDGLFLGECGMGISETIGVGDPKKVMAFEVWLFDKNDIRTVTRVLMSEHAFKDEALKSRLAAKGDPVQVRSGDVVSMDTATLTVTARVVDMAYGGGALPPNSHFERLTIELAAYQKAAG
jgi:hypothetical protein